MPSHGNLERLVEASRKGDPEAWGEVYEALAPKIYTLCRRVLPEREDAEDATAEVFLKARLHLARYDASRPFQPWLFRVAANHCWDELRKRRTRAEIDEPEETLGTLADDAPSPQETVLLEESRIAIRRAVGELEDRSRLALVLRYFSDMSYEEIAEVLGISPTFVGVVLLRARRTLRKRLSP